MAGLVLRPVADAAIRAHGRAAFPHECCGALLGRDGVVHEAYGLPNTTEEGPRRRFLVRPGDYRGEEWAGVCFDPAGELMFVNLQRPGISFAIWGPW